MKVGNTSTNLYKERIHDPGPYKHPRLYEDRRLYQDQGPCEDPGPYVESIW